MPAMEAVQLTLGHVIYIANHLDVPVKDIQAAAEYFIKIHPSGCYFVIDWNAYTGYAWSVFSKNKFNECFYFSQPENMSSFQPVRFR